MVMIRHPVILDDMMMLMVIPSAANGACSVYIGDMGTNE